MKRPTIEGMPSPAARQSANQDSASAPAFDLDVKRSVLRHPKLAASVAVVVLVLVVAFGLSRTKMYQAESLTYIEPMASKVLNQAPTQDGYDSVRYDTYIQQQMQTALRPDILATAIGKLPPFVWQYPGESMQSAVARLQSSLKVERVLTSYQLSITLSDPNPETAASVVNAVTNTYLEQGRKDEHAEIDQRLTLLQEERQRIQQNLNEDRVEQASLGSALGVANPTGLVGNQYDTQIAGVQTQVATAREARDAAAAQLESLQGQGGTASPALAAAAEEVINSDTGLGSLKATISERKAVLNTQMAGMLPANTVYQQDQAEIADLDRSLDLATAQLREKVERRLQAKMRADLERTAGLENKLNGELKHQTATATSAAPKLQRATDLAADIERLTARYGVVDDVMRGLQLESNGPGLAHLSVAAVVPVGPEPSKSKLILLLALPLALLAGAGAAVMAHRYDPHIYSPPDVEKVLGFLPIGVMPARAEVSDRVMEEYTLRLAAGLQSAYRTSSAQSFVFTAASSTMEIGKFVLAIERILGTLGFKALALDATSVLNPGSRTPSTQRGLTMHRASALVRTIDGVRQGFAAEEIERLKSKYDMVLIDAPPLLNSAETEYLVRCADATILIAESGVTVKSELYQSAVLLQQLNVAGVGAVLQELHLKDADASFRASIAAVERVQRVRAENAGEITSGGADAEETATDEETADEVAERLRQMSVPESRTGAKVDVAPAVRAAGMSPAPKESRETAVETPGRASAPGPVAVEPERSSRISAEQNSERVALAGGMGQESAQVHIEERDQVRPWRELLRLRKEMAAEPTVPDLEEESMNAEQAAREPEPLLYFEDRMRPRKAEPSASSPAAPAEMEEDKNAEPLGSQATIVDEPSASEPVLVATNATETDSPVHAPAPDFTEGSSVEFWGAERQHEPGAEENYFETAIYETTNVEDAIHEPRPAGIAAHWEELEAKPAVESGADLDGEIEAALEVAAHPDAEKMHELVPDVDDVAVPVGQIAASESEAVAEHEAEPLGQETVSDPTATEDVEPEMIAAVASAAPSPWRAPAAPKMEWFTLKFRGTSERVLRLVPGEETAEDVETGHGASGEGPMPTAHAEAARLEHRSESSHKETVFDENRHPALGDDTARDHYSKEFGSETVASSEPAEMSREHAEVGNLSSAEQGRLIYRPSEVEEWTPAALDALESRGDEEVEQDSPAPQFEANGRGIQFEPRMSEAPDRNAWIDEPLERRVELEATAASAEPDFAERVMAAEVEDPIVVGEAPVARAKINRWAVEDHAPTAAMHGGESNESGERFSPVRLMGELRSRSAGMTQFDTPYVSTRTWSRRSAAAPVEERLQPRAAGLTRRWEMLSRFDSAPGQEGVEENATLEVPAAAEQGGR